MSQILTDEEMLKAYTHATGKRISHRKSERESFFRSSRAIESAVLAKMSSEEPVAFEFQDTDGKWCTFLDQRHFDNTRADGRWPIRALYEHPPAPSAVEAKYNELLMAVAQKFSNETRHETALRYIMDRERWTEFKPLAAAMSE